MTRGKIHRPWSYTHALSFILWLPLQSSASELQDTDQDYNQYGINNSGFLCKLHRDIMSARGRTESDSPYYHHMAH